ncbi:MAG: aconitase family protein, partial [Halanaeroarchaeum sp.]
MPDPNPFGAIRDIDIDGSTYKMADLSVLEEKGVIDDADKLPVSIRILLESVIRNADGEMITEQDVENAASWQPDVPDHEVPFTPSRIVLQDLTGVPAVVDLAALRSAADRKGVDPNVVEPEIPADLVIDHSVQVDYYGSEDAFQKNVEIEYERNEERYKA